MARRPAAPARASDRVAALPAIRKTQPKTAGAPVWDQAGADAILLQCRLENNLFLAWSGNLDGENGSAPPPDWTQFMKYIRSDLKDEHAQAIIPGQSSLYEVITDKSIDEDPTAKETIQIIIHRSNWWRLRLKKQAIFLEADAGELIPIIQQLVGSQFENHLCPWPGGLHIVFAMMGSIATFVDGWGTSTAFTACKWFGSTANATKALRAKDYNRTLTQPQLSTLVLSCVVVLRCCGAYRIKHCTCAAFLCCSVLHCGQSLMERHYAYKNLPVQGGYRRSRCCGRSSA